MLGLIICDSLGGYQKGNTPYIGATVVVFTDGISASRSEIVPEAT
jgi:C-terminal processing protease CtpA/Prc